MIFIVNHQVDYKMGFLVAAGSMAGAWIGARMSVKWGPGVVRFILLAVLLIASAKLLGIF